MVNDQTVVRDDEWVELFAFGVAFGPAETRPVLILKDAEEKNSLPVWITPLDASLVVEEVNPQSLGQGPHSASRQILQSLSVEIEKCLFTEVIGHHQFVDLILKNHPTEKRMRFRADQIMSFCLHSKARFFCTEKFIDECRILNDDMSEQTHQLDSHQGHPQQNFYLM